MRKIEREIDKSLVIWREPYYSLGQFEQDTIIWRRDKMCKRYLYEDKDADPESYLVTETEIPYIPVQSRQVNLNGQYAVETRGIWRTNTRSMGGPFIGITLVDESTNYLYYIEGFVFSPGKPQRETIRELETILYTLKTGIKSAESAK